ncbi:LOW QUALITY PROTEIN: potassium channel subfamily U member 1 [Chlamydotis macqueenii]
MTHSTAGFCDSIFVFLGGLLTILAVRLAQYGYGFIIEKIWVKKKLVCANSVSYAQIFKPQGRVHNRNEKQIYSIKVSKLFAVFIRTWLTAAGFIHLVENSGVPWVQPANSHLSYSKHTHLVMMTVSTVGYGDVVVLLGRTFIIFFTIGSFVLFANFILEVVEIVGSHRNYKSSYEVVSGKNYFVVSDNIALESVTTFLDFLLQDKGNVCTEILFLGESLPSLELEAVFKCCSACTAFLYGSALNSEESRADVQPPQPYTEDTSNTMRFKNNNVELVLHCL